jgi:hypothetical protein
MSRRNLLWVVAGLVFQAALLAGVALVSRPTSALPCRASLQAWFGGSCDTVAGQGPVFSRPLPEDETRSGECYLEIPPECYGRLQPQQTADFVPTLEQRLELLHQRIEQTRRDLNVGWEAVSDNILLEQDETFAHIYYYYGRVCDGLRRLQLVPDEVALLKLRDEVLQDYTAARRALELAECATLASARSEEVSGTGPRTGTRGTLDTFQDLVSGSNPDRRLALPRPSSSPLSAR